MTEPRPQPQARWHPIQFLGRSAIRSLDKAAGIVRYVGGMAILTGQAGARFTGGFRRGRKVGFRRIVEQMARVGVRSLPIVCLVQVFVGIILALQMAPTLQQFGQLEKIATIIGIAVFRELGPLITAIVLSGFAGASIAAEIGAMVEGEEIKALRAHALDPIHFLVLPRVAATVVMLAMLTVLADIVGAFGGWLTGVGILRLTSAEYIETTIMSLQVRDFLTGLFKAGVFGGLISVIACYEGLKVQGGSIGVGKATTSTVVKSIVGLIGVDCVFTAIFYRYGW